MRMSSWLRSACSLFVPSRIEKGNRPTRLRKRALAAPLSVERLEDRNVPSTFTVYNLADSGIGSLRESDPRRQRQPRRRPDPLRPRGPRRHHRLDQRPAKHHGRPDHRRPGR